MWQVKNIQNFWCETNTFNIFHSIYDESNIPYMMKVKMVFVHYE
jgi:hypothetical protein